jgi:hypothetical protein
MRACIKHASVQSLVACAGHSPVPCWHLRCTSTSPPNLKMLSQANQLLNPLCSCCRLLEPPVLQLTL